MAADLSLLMLFAKLKVLGKRHADLEVDIVRLGSERAYAAEVLRRLSRAMDPELIAAAVETMSRLGLLCEARNRSP